MGADEQSPGKSSKTPSASNFEASPKLVAEILTRYAPYGINADVDMKKVILHHLVDIERLIEA